MQQIPQQRNEPPSLNKQQTTSVYWFRQDLRLSDNPALSFVAQQCLQQGSCLALVICLPEDPVTRWGFTRVGQHRKVYLAETVRDLATQCEQLGNRLLVIAGNPTTQLPLLLHQLNTNRIYCEEIAAPEEVAQVESLRQQAILVNGLQKPTQISAIWQSSLLDPAKLPFEISDLPLVFTRFRNLLKKPTASLPRHCRKFCNYHKAHIRHQPSKLST